MQTQKSPGRGYRGSSLPFRLVEFQYENLGKIESVNGEMLLSNWVEVDTEAVIALLRKELGK